MSDRDAITDGATSALYQHRKDGARERRMHTLAMMAATIASGIEAATMTNPDWDDDETAARSVSIAENILERIGL